MLKYYQFEDNESDATKLQILKCQYVDAHNNKNAQNIEKYEGDSN